MMVFSQTALTFSRSVVHMSFSGQLRRRFCGQDGQQLLPAVCLSVAATFFLAMTMVRPAPLRCSLLPPTGSSLPPLGIFVFYWWHVEQPLWVFGLSAPTADHSFPAPPTLHAAVEQSCFISAHKTFKCPENQGSEGWREGQRNRNEHFFPGPTHCFGRIKAPLLLPPPIGAWLLAQLWLCAGYGHGGGGVVKESEEGHEHVSKPCNYQTERRPYISACYWRRYWSRPSLAFPWIARPKQQPPAQRWVETIWSTRFAQLWQGPSPTSVDKAGVLRLSGITVCCCSAAVLQWGAGCYACAWKY